MVPSLPGYTKSGGAAPPPAGIELNIVGPYIPVELHLQYHAHDETLLVNQSSWLQVEKTFQWWRDLFRFRIDLLNFSMGFNIIAPFMEFLHLNWYIAEWFWYLPAPWTFVNFLPGLKSVLKRLTTSSMSHFRNEGALTFFCSLLPGHFYILFLAPWLFWTPFSRLHKTPSGVSSLANAVVMEHVWNLHGTIHTNYWDFIAPS